MSIVLLLSFFFAKLCEFIDILPVRQNQLRELIVHLKTAAESIHSHDGPVVLARVIQRCQEAVEVPCETIEFIPVLRRNGTKSIGRHVLDDHQVIFQHETELLRVIDRAA